MTATPIPTRAEDPRRSEPLELTHMDVVGPITPASLAGHRYFLLVTDDYSRRSSVRVLSKEQELAMLLVQPQTTWQQQSAKQARRL